MPGSPLMTISGLVSHLRWILLHLTEETARHNGHLGILRELADGTREGVPSPGRRQGAGCGSCWHVPGAAPRLPGSAGCVA